MAKGQLKFHQKGWDEVARHVVETEVVPRMKRVADACNNDMDGYIAGLEGYKVSVEGDKPLRKRDFRATVITATGAAMRDNAKNNTLVRNFHRAAGD